MVKIHLWLQSVKLSLSKQTEKTPLPLSNIFYESSILSYLFRISVIPQLRYRMTLIRKQLL